MFKAALPPIRDAIPSDWLRDCNSFLVSAIIHLIALVLLALLTMTNHNGWSDLQLFAQMGDGYEAPQAGDDSLDNALGSFELDSDDAAAALGPTTAFDSSTSLVTTTGAYESPLDAIHDSGLEGQSIGDGAGAGLAGSGGDDGNGGAEFFGIGGKGGSFVYVVDISGSMDEDGKWKRARDELMRSIEHLSENQKFYIIFYNDGWFPMASPRPVPPTRRQIDRTRRWVDQVWPNGGTFPLDALKHALSMKPDAIYFLSDGLFDPQVVDTLRIANAPESQRIPIHTVAFVSQDNIAMMKMIAKNSGGKFRFVQ